MTGHGERVWSTVDRKLLPQAVVCRRPAFDGLAVPATTMTSLAESSRRESTRRPLASNIRAERPLSQEELEDTTPPERLLPQEMLAQLQDVNVLGLSYFFAMTGRKEAADERFLA